ncbi:Spindle pole body component alp6 [Vanrija pseudolonga]|uniref:Spindle pole body component alp6 n=1 Tax=Vanrija pseudolonga TaxID=143232 RepID=A0AAF0YCI2_9TREE|nr:Spindle pole body component alp6 [Vanrija pseudolonga]
MSRSGRTSSPLETLIFSVLPELGKLPDRARQERVDELVEFCEDILASRLPSSVPFGSATLPDHARRVLPSPDDALRFTSLWTSLERGRTLSVPHRHLQFLLALSQLNPNTQESVFPPASASSRQRHSRAPSSLGTPPRPGVSPAAVLGESRTINLDSGPPSPVSAGPSTARSKAALLAEWRTARHRPPFPEALLLRDALYLLQGINGRYVRFAVAPAPQNNPYLSERGRAGDGTGFPLGAEGTRMLDAKAEAAQEVVGIDIVADEAKSGYISQPTRSIMAQLSEMGVLYRKITRFINLHQAAGPSSKSGMVIQSLCHFLHHELSEYHRLLAVLESQLALTSPATGSAAEGSALTLLRLGVWTEDMKLKLQLMEAVVDDANSAHGGALVSKIHSHTSHGDPLTRKFTDQILEKVSQPFFLTLQRWMLSGELHDPFNEFFVQLNPDVGKGDDPLSYGDAGFEEGLDSAGGVTDSHYVWEKKYVFVKAMVPGFISEDFAKKIFSTGRSLNFIRYNCYDSDWIAAQANQARSGEALKYSDLPGLERSIDDAYSSASRHLLEIFFDKYKLQDHLQALKAYLMLGAGDFAELLMESLAPRLSKPAISLYRHHLTSDLESAIRGSNAQYDPPDVLRRLDARILEYSHGELGWDCFALEYKVEAPLNAVLDERSMVGYDRLFHHLWRLKRVETAVTQGWMRVTSASRAFELLENLDNDWHHCRIVQAEMVHFLRQFQSFCQLEVIECSWQVLQEFVAKREGDLDALITAHRTYLDRVVQKVLLLGNRRDRTDTTLLNLVQEALDNILQFRGATDDLYSWSLGEATRVDRERDGERGLSTDEEAAAAEKEASLLQLEGIRDRIRGCSNRFQDAVVTICKEAGSHADLDVRFLALRIAFNGHYALRRSSKGKK